MLSNNKDIKDEYVIQKYQCQAKEEHQHPLLILPFQAGSALHMLHFKTFLAKFCFSGLGRIIKRGYTT